MIVLDLSMSIFLSGNLARTGNLSGNLYTFVLAQDVYFDILEASR